MKLHSRSHLRLNSPYRMQRCRYSLWTILLEHLCITIQASNPRRSCSYFTDCIYNTSFLHRAGGCQKSVWHGLEDFIFSAYSNLINYYWHLYAERKDTVMYRSRCFMWVHWSESMKWCSKSISLSPLKSRSMSTTSCLPRFVMSMVSEMSSSSKFRAKSSKRMVSCRAASAVNAIFLGWPFGNKNTIK